MRSASLKISLSEKVEIVNNIIKYSFLPCGKLKSLANLYSNNCLGKLLLYCILGLPGTEYDSYYKDNAGLKRLLLKMETFRNF